MLTDSLKISDTTMREFFDVIFFQRDRIILQKYCRADLSSVLEVLTC